MMRCKSVVAALAALISSVALADLSEIDITAAVRSANAATVTSTATHVSSYTVASAFDGNIPSGNNTGRWLVASPATTADATYEIGSAYQEGKSVLVTRVRVYRQSGTGVATIAQIARAPKKWKIYARDESDTEWTLIGEETGAEWDSTKSTDYVETEIKAFAPSRKYRFEFENPEYSENSCTLLVAEVVLMGYVEDPAAFEPGGVPEARIGSVCRVALAADIDWTVSGYGNFCTYADAKIIWADNEMFTDAREIDLGRLTAAPPVSGSERIDNLVPGETYYAKLTASNEADGSMTTDPIAFSVLAAAPDLSDGGDLVAAVNAARERIEGGESQQETITLGAGTYSIASELVIDQPISLVGVEGAEKTFVRQTAAATRVVSLAASGASLSGITFVGSDFGTNGSDVQGGCVSVNAAGCTVTGCTMTGASGGGQKRNVRGGGLYMSANAVDSLVSDCVITNNMTCRMGAGAYLEGGTLTRSRISGNGRSTSGNSHDCGFGGGVYVVRGTVSYCVIDHNSSFRFPGAGVVMHYPEATVDHCTIVANSSPEAGAGVLVRNGTLSNSIVWGNSFGDLTCDSGTVTNVCAPRLLKDDMDNTYENPAFVDFEGGDYRPFANSPVVGANGAYLGALAPADETGVLPETVVSDDAEIFVSAGDDLLAAVDGARRTAAEKGVAVTVRLPAAEFSIHDEVIMDQPISIVGADRDETIVRSAAGNGLSGPFGMNRAVRLGHADAVIQNLTVVGGKSNGGSTGSPSYVKNGLGILLTDGTVTNCTVRGSLGGSQNAQSYGGGIRQSGGLVVDSLITQCSGNFYGAGIYMNGGVAERIVVSSNTNSVWSPGGTGVYMTGGATLRNSLVYGNRMMLLGSNQGGHSGVGVYANGSGLTIDGCTIVDNLCEGTETGAGVRFGDGSAAAPNVMRNTIIAGNVRGAENGVPDDLVRGGYAGTRNIIEHCCIPSAVVDGEGNVMSDPGFADADNGDYSLTLGSLCIDSGTATQGGDALDLVHRPRALDGDADGMALPDMGCYEYVIGGDGLSVIFSADGGTDGYGTLGVTFTSSVIYDGVQVDPSEVTYTWNFGDGTTVSGTGAEYASRSHDFTAAGASDVSLSVLYRGEEANFVRESLVKIYSDIIYVAPASSGRPGVFPYATEATATSDLTEAHKTAVLAVGAGATRMSIRLLPGEHPLTSSFALSFAGEVVGLGAKPEETVVLPDAQILAFDISAADTLVANLTVRGAYRNNGNVNGAAFSLTADGVISNCVAEACRASGHGNGTYGHGLYAAKGKVVDMIVRNCLPNDTGYRGNSAVYLTGTAFADRCVITNNAAGGSASSATSWTNFGSKGIGASVIGRATLRNSLVADNESGYCGGAGLYVANYAVVENCTVAGNRILDFGGNGNSESGAGIYIENKEVTVRSCIVCCNTRWGAADDIAVTSDAAFGSITYTLSPSLADYLDGTGNLLSDPLFKNAVRGDYRLKTGSPAHNAGFNAEWCEGATDLAGKNRKSGTVDMGCYESSPSFAIILR